MRTDFLPGQSSDWSEVADSALLAAIKDRQVEALQEMYRRHSRLVHGTALRILQTADDAEDLTQEIFLQLWQKPRYDASRGKLSTYLSLLTRSRALDRVRSRGAKSRLAHRWHHSQVSSAMTNNPLENAHQSEQVQRVRQALMTLTPTEREVLEIAYYEGLSQSQVAQRLNIPLGTVKTRSRTALKKLRRTLKDHL
ncbi:MAG: sigma-70 family RNA polymerase sigma factor [Cyanobacteria bacterium J06628_6]